MKNFMVNCPLETGKRPCMCSDLPRCPECGYTKHDSAFEMDHHHCPGEIPADDEERRADEREAQS